jgi:hypothetical protein
VESLDFGRASSGATDRQALIVGYNETGRLAGLPTALFCKYSNSFQQRLWLGNSQLMQHEVGFYRSIRPQLDIETPRAWHAAWHPVGWQSVVLLEDLGVTKGATFCVALAPVTRAMLENLLDEMARYHARFWNDSRLEREWAWLPTPLALFTRFCETFSFRKQVFAGLEVADPVVPDVLKSRNDALWRAYGLSCAESNTAPRCLLHGDPHIGNTYMTAQGRMGFNDWQVVMRGNWAWDFTYLLLTALTIEQRREWEHDLLRYYLNRLAHYDADNIGFDTAWLAYRRHTLHALMGWLVTIGAAGVQPKEQQKNAISLAVIERAAVAMVDLDSIASF